MRDTGLGTLGPPTEGRKNFGQVREAADIQRAATADGNHSAAIAAVVTKAKLAGLWIERKENKNTNFNTKVIDRRNVPVTELSDEELLAIAAGALPERDETKVLLLPPAPKSTR